MVVNNFLMFKALLMLGMKGQMAKNVQQIVASGSET